MQHLYSFAKSFPGLMCLFLCLSTGAAFAQSGSSLFGNGFDKDVTIGANTKLDRDMYYHNLTIKSGYILKPGGFRIFVSGTLTMEDGARIDREGNDAGYAQGIPLTGAGLSAGTLGGSGAGAHGFATAAEVLNSLGGSGGGEFGGKASRPAAAAGGEGVFRSAIQALNGRSLNGSVINGGAGGGGGVVDGGGGGGVIVIAASRIVVSSGTAFISAKGGDSLMGGGGCGGGGGVVVVITTTAQPAGLSLSAIGGDSQTSRGADGYTSWLTTTDSSDTATDTTNPRPATPSISPAAQQILCGDVGLKLTSSSKSGNQWYRDGTMIDGANNEEYVARVAGAYTVVVSANHDFSEPSAATTVLGNPPPQLAYRLRTTTDGRVETFEVTANESISIKPYPAPSDNTSISSIKVQSAGTYAGNISVDQTTGEISISNAGPEGTHTITIRATDSCGATTDASFLLNVVAAPNPPPELSYGVHRSDNAVWVDEFPVPLKGSLTITPSTGPSDNTKVSSIVVYSTDGYTGSVSVDRTTGVVSINNAGPSGIHIITIRITDDHGGFTDAPIQLNVAKDLLSYQSTTNATGTPENFDVAANGTRTITPTIPPDASVSTVAVQSKGSYSGTISVDDRTGVVSIINAGPAGVYLITIRAISVTGAITDATFNLNVQ